MAVQIGLAAITLAGIGGTLETATAAPVADAAPFRSSPALDPIVGEANAALFAITTDDPAAFEDAIGTLAEEVGARLQIDPARFVSAWTATELPQMRVMLSALTQLGVGYRYATSKPGVAFDCSGLVKWAWSRSGVALPSQSTSIIRSMTSTSIDELEPADVVWYPGHVMLSLGVDFTIVHAVHPGRPLQIDTIPTKKISRLRAIDPLG